MSGFVERSAADVRELFASVGRILARGAWPALAAMFAVGIGGAAPAAVFGGVFGGALGAIGELDVRAVVEGAIGIACIVAALAFVPASSSGALAAFSLAARSEHVAVPTAIMFSVRRMPRVLLSWAAIGVSLGGLVVLAAISGALAHEVATSPLIALVLGGSLVAAGAFGLAPIFVLVPAIAGRAMPSEPLPSFFELERRNALIIVAALAPIVVLVASQPSAIGLDIAGSVVGATPLRVAVRVVGALAFIFIHALFAAAALDVVSRERREASDAA